MDALITIPSREDRAHLPLAEQITFYDVIMRCTVYLPLQAYFRRMIEYYDVTPFHLVPNVYCSMATLYIIFTRLGLGELRIEDFAWFFQIKNCTDFGFFYFRKWAVEGLIGIEGIYDNMGSFKSNFFYMPLRLQATLECRVNFFPSYIFNFRIIIYIFCNNHVFCHRS